MGVVSRDQALEAGAKIQTNINWEALDSQGLQETLRDPIALGQEATRFLANGGRVQIIMTTDGIRVPEGGRIHMVAVPVNESRDWAESVRAAGPDTGRDWAIWRMGGEYPSKEGISGLRKVVLVHFGKGKNTRSEENIAWAKSQGLAPASPRTVFAVSEYSPNLNRDLGMDLAVVSLEQCFFGGMPDCACVWFDGSERKAYDFWFEGDWGDDCWFAFVRESELGLSAS